MKKLLVVISCTCVLFSCSKKTIPSKTISGSTDTVSTANKPAPVINDSISTDSAATPSSTTVMVIADGYGRLITPQQNLPQDAGIKYNNLQLSKGFTTQQRANLQARYKTIPPRVLFVPQQYSLSSLKGNYYIYKKKFWYWKKTDGLFYLDEKYYL